MGCVCVYVYGMVMDDACAKNTAHMTGALLCRAELQPSALRKAAFSPLLCLCWQPDHAAMCVP